MPVSFPPGFVPPVPPAPALPGASTTTTTTTTTTTKTAPDGQAAPARPGADATRATIDDATVDAARVRAAGGPAAQALQHRLLAASAGTSVAERRTRVQSVVDDILRTRGADMMLTAVDGPCLDIAAAWLPALRAAGLPARIATVDPALRPAGGPAVRAGHEGKFHAFIVVGEPGQDPIIVDGSWRQFVAGAAARPDLEPVLVGTHADVVRRFAPEARALQVELVEDPLLGRRNAAATAELVYGAGAYAGLRMVLEP